jgi:ribosomal protein S18 acetylase RimI-like enzyme
MKVSETQMRIRKAEVHDRDDVSRLHVMAGPNVYKYCFACSEDQAVAVNRILFDTTDTFCSRQYYYVCESHDGVQGAVGIYPGRDNAALGKNVGRYIRDLAGITGYRSLITMALRHRMGNRFPVLGDEELYIEALAVYPEFRGRGVSSAMLKFAFEECARMKLPFVSLFAEVNNERAIAIYRGKGFKVEDTVVLPRRYRRHNLYGFHKMTAPVGALL